VMSISSLTVLVTSCRVDDKPSMKTERDPRSLVGQKIDSDFPVTFFSKKPSIL